MNIASLWHIKGYSLLVKLPNKRATIRVDKLQI